MAYTPTPEDNETIANLPGDIRAVNTKVDNHTNATGGAHAASAVSYGAGTVEAALNTAAGHAANQSNPHGVTAAQAGAVALADAVTTVTAGKIVKRDANGKVAGDITGNAATATSATTAASCTGNAATATLAGNSNLLQGYNAAQVAAMAAPHGKQLFTSNGTFTVPAGITRVWVSLCGGGGGGGMGSGSSVGGGGGGGGGGAAKLAQLVTGLTPGQQVSVTIGAGGAAATVENGRNGGSGGISSFGSFISCAGGGGGSFGDRDNCGRGGIAGGPGGASGQYGANYGVIVGGDGGGTIFGSGGSVSYYNESTSGSLYGGGGGGSPTGQTSTGAGAPGFVLVEW